MKVYHYRKLDRWKEEKAKLQLYPHLGLTTYANSVVHGQRVIFGLIEPTPKKWVNSTDFPGVWSNLTFNTGRLLLELDVNPTQDGVFVLDQGHMRTVQNGAYLDTSPLRYHHKSDDDAARAYINSRIPIEEYLNQRDELEYSLPEVVIWGNVVLGNVRESPSQPVLEELLEKLRQGQPAKDLDRFSSFARGVLDDVRTIPELKPWYLEYITRHPEIKNEWKTGIGEHARRMKERFF